MKIYWLVLVSAIASMAVSQGIISRVSQQWNAASQTSQHPRGLLTDGVSTILPACALECQVQFAPATSSFDSIKEICSDQPSPAVSEKLEICLTSSCTVLELLETRRFIAESCHDPRTDLGPMIMAVIWVSGGMSVVVVFLRVLARTVLLETGRFTSNKWGWDDTIIIVTLIANLASGVVTSLAVVEGGFGKDVWVLAPSQIAYGIKNLVLTEPIYYFSLGQVKVAILLFYMRVFTGRSYHRFGILCWVSIAVISIYTVLHMLMVIFQCWPVSYAWTRFDGQDQGTCWDYGASVLTHGILNMASDWIIFVIPIKNLLELKMNRAKKALAIAMLAWGLAGSVCSVFRLIELIHGTRSSFKEDANITLRFAKFLMWSIAETNFALFCACMPMAVQVVRRIEKRARGFSPQSFKFTRKIHSFRSHSRTGDLTESRRSATTGISRQGHLSLELTNTPDVALGELRVHRTAIETEAPTVRSSGYKSGKCCQDEDKGSLLPSRNVTA